MIKLWNYEDYICPRLQEIGEVSNKTDVYSFGVVILETITGREPKGLAKDILQRSNLQEIDIDPLTPPPLPSEEIKIGLMTIGKNCVDPNPQTRPSIDVVLSDITHLLNKLRKK